MFIAATSEGNNIDSHISERFETCKFILIVNTDDMSTKAIKNNSDDHENKLAYDVIEHDCEAIITGSMKSNTFDILANACITRYTGKGHSVKSALDMMEKRELDFIKNPEGKENCDGTHDHKECDGARH